MEWDRQISSKKLKISADNLTINGADGSCFRTAIGNFVRLQCHAKEFEPGKKYFFQILVIGGNLKVGVCTNKVNVNNVKECCRVGIFGWEGRMGDLQRRAAAQQQQLGSQIWKKAQRRRSHWSLARHRRSNVSDSLRERSLSPSTDKTSASPLRMRGCRRCRCMRL
eukprot:TRINITY_DN9003_c0_g1_i2.p2 TRINITY_DN9003_c0_g1~~TRINITY_DN9003_c0_g1_i2.p2  ORF type:complete len:166 (+),score=1.28 TRINITY_DN9003_c0_g1_i2:182-679(+)